VLADFMARQQGLAFRPQTQPGELYFYWIRFLMASLPIRARATSAGWPTKLGLLYPNVNLSSCPVFRMGVA